MLELFHVFCWLDPLFWSGWFDGPGFWKVSALNGVFHFSWIAAACFFYFYPRRVDMVKYAESVMLRQSEVRNGIAQQLIVFLATLDQQYKNAVKNLAKRVEIDQPHLDKIKEDELKRRYSGEALVDARQRFDLQAWVRREEAQLGQRFERDTQDKIDRLFADNHRIYELKHKAFKAMVPDGRPIQPSPQAAPVAQELKSDSAKQPEVIRSLPSSQQVVTRTFLYFALNWMFLNAMLLLRSCLMEALSMTDEGTSHSSWTALFVVYVSFAAMLFHAVVYTPERWDMLEKFNQYINPFHDIEFAHMISPYTLLKLRLKTDRNGLDRSFLLFLAATYQRVRIVVLWVFSIFNCIGCVVDPILPQSLRSEVSREIVLGILHWHIVRQAMMALGVILLLEVDRRCFWLLVQVRSYIRRLYNSVYRGGMLPSATKVAVVVALCLMAFSSMHAPMIQYGCRKDLHKEYLGDGASQEVMDSIDAVVRMKMRQESGLESCPWAQVVPGSVKRATHAKSHGCVTGTFVLNDMIPERFKAGLFDDRQSKKTYQAWIRYTSAGRDGDDTEVDARAMSIKLLNVQGRKIWEDDGYPDEELTTQDWLGITSSVFPLDDPKSYSDFLRFQATPNPAKAIWLTLKYLVGPTWWNPLSWRWHFAMVGAGVKKAGAAMTNPLTGTYYSATAYQWGQSAVKYQFVPCHVNQTRKSIDEQHYGKSGDYLRLAMMRHLDPNADSGPDDEVCFYFNVMEQTDPCLQPIDDPSIEWEGQWVNLATVHIPRQHFARDDQVRFCDAVAFSPWNGLSEHRPLGAVNVGRKVSYIVSRDIRNRLNGYQQLLVVPTGNETFSDPVWANPYAGAGDVDNYQYARYPNPFSNLPVYIKGEAFEDFPFMKKVTILQTHLSSWRHFMHVGGSKPFDAWRTPDDYAHLFDPVVAVANMTPTAFHRSWMEDAEFARQFISGINSGVIKMCDRIPEVMLASFNKDVQLRVAEALKGQGTLSYLLKHKRIFSVDYEILKGIERYADRVFYEPIILFYLREERVEGEKAVRRYLMPLAIQLHREPHTVNHIFISPKLSSSELLHHEAGRVWLFARMHAICADANYHETVAHLGLTHLALEPIIIAFRRQLTASHPLMQLVGPHMHETLTINSLGRETLLKADSSYFDQVLGVGRNGALQLIARVYRNHYRMENETFPQRMARNGFTQVENPGEDNAEDPLPGYLYRDYGFMLWNAIHSYVESYLSAHYDSDEAVRQDKMLQDLLDDMRDPHRADIPGVPHVDSLQKLVDMASYIVFTATAEHSAVNFGQTDFYSFIPNRPLLLRRPMPRDLSRVTVKYIMEALPDEVQSQMTILMASTLSLMDHEGTLFDWAIASSRTRPEDRHLMQFKHQLEHISNHTLKRNTELGIYWPYLDPKQRMAYSTNI